MCQKCQDANAKLEQFLTELEEEFKGTEVNGTPVQDDHHIAVALVGALMERQTGRELLDVLLKQRLESAFISMAGGESVPTMMANPFAREGRKEVGN